MSMERQKPLDWAKAHRSPMGGAAGLRSFFQKSGVPRRGEDFSATGTASRPSLRAGKIASGVFLVGLGQSA